jgi:hypothetical protein
MTCCIRDPAATGAENCGLHNLFAGRIVLVDMDEVSTESLTLVERVVLLGVVEAAQEDAAPAPSWAIRDRCEELLDQIDAEVLSRLAEQDVMRALSVLGSEPYVEEHTDDRSPAGKGRPKYSLGAEPDEVLDALTTDDRLADAVDAVDTT